MFFVFFLKFVAKPPKKLYNGYVNTTNRLKETALMEMQFDYATFRKNLRDLIESNGKSLRDTAAELGVSFTTLSRYTNGHREPDLKYVILLAQYFRVSVDWLLGFHEDRYETLAPETRELIALYNIASPDDRLVVDAVLNKYREEK